MNDDPLEQNPRRVTSADLVVGIPSFNEAQTIRFSTIAADNGLKAFFPDKKCVIINCDNASPDGTGEAFLSLRTETPKIYLSTPDGVRGKGNNLFNLFRRSLELGAQGIVIVDADVVNITPLWIRHLAEPLFKQFALVTPLYVRHPFEGTISNNIIQPMIRFLYGRRVREPIGGDFGISQQLAATLIEEPRESFAEGFGIDVLLTTTALGRGMPVCQSFVGGTKAHKRRDPDTGINGLFLQTVGTLFHQMVRHHSFWLNVRWSKPIAVFGLESDDRSHPEKVEIQMETYHQNFVRGFSLFEPLWKRILHRDLFSKLQELKGFRPEQFELPTLLWALILVDFALAFKTRKETIARLMEALVPLYFGRSCSMASETANMTLQQIEVHQDEQCRIFEEIKPYLVQQWLKP